MAEGTTSPIPKPAQADDTDRPPAIKPLTRRGYKRLPAVERQIREASALDETALVAAAQVRDETASEYLPAEALVYFIRCADSNGNRRTRDALFRELLERCIPFFRGKFRGFTKEEREDLQQDVMTKIVEDMLAPDDSGDFMQVRFWAYLKRKTIDACKTAFRPNGEANNGEFEVRSKPESREDTRLMPEELTMLSEGLAKLPPSLRQVFILRHAVGIKIGSDDPTDDDPGEITLARHFHCTGRTIRNWLKEADGLLAGFREK